MPRSVRLLFVVLLAAWPLFGCGSRTEVFPVTGKVTYKGHPLTGGMVMFAPADGPASMGNIDEKGYYRLVTHGLGEGAIPGQHVVTVTSRAGGEKMATVPGPLRSAVPRKYATIVTSPLKAEVKNQPNEIDLELVD
jgi:hypothetical protein